MALYRYFRGKADVIALMIDSVADSPPHFGSPALPWHTRLKRWAKWSLEIYRDHPWFLEATTARQTPMGPNELLWMEAALAMLAESGLGSKERHHAFVAIIGHVRGYATFQQIGGSRGAGKEWAWELSQLLLPEANRHPVLLDVLRSGAFSESTAAFDFGLDCKSRRNQRTNKPAEEMMYNFCSPARTVATAYNRQHDGMSGHSQA